MGRRTRSLAALTSLVALLASTLAADASAHPPATPRAECPDDSLREADDQLQGRVSAADVASGRAALGYMCNTSMVSRFGHTEIQAGAGGYKVFRYIDSAGNVCGFYDSTLLFPLNVIGQRENLPGVHVLDMSDPSAPRKTANLVTPAMLTPHESLDLNQQRGLLAAASGTPVFAPGLFDIYDVSENCLQPKLLSSTPLGILGHEGAFSPDGNTYWVSSTGGRTLTALDVSDPRVPKILWTGRYNFHGVSLSDDGTRLYAADLGTPGLRILDVAEIQNRTPDPTVREISHMTWDNVSIPQNSIPVTIGGHPYLVEIDEFARGTGAGNPSAPVGAVRIIDIADEAAPDVVSDIRLEVHQPENIATIRDDPGATFQFQGYAAHYCSVPQREDPGIVACSMILSGLRVFDIRDPHAPREIAYFNGPIPQTDRYGRPGSAHAMSAPAFDPDHGHIWYSDGATGFFVVDLRSSAWPASP